MTGPIHDKPHDDDQVLDPQPLITMFDNDMETVREILNEFVQPTNKIIDEIINAYNEKSAEKIEMAAHKLKSSARSVGAYKLGDICEQIERAGKQVDWKEIDDLVPLLQPCMKDIVTRIRSF